MRQTLAYAEPLQGILGFLALLLQRGLSHHSVRLPVPPLDELYNLVQLIALDLKDTHFNPDESLAGYSNDQFQWEGSMLHTATAVQG